MEGGLAPAITWMMIIVVMILGIAAAARIPSLPEMVIAGAGTILVLVLLMVLDIMDTRSYDMPKAGPEVYVYEDKGDGYAYHDTEETDAWQSAINSAFSESDSTDSYDKDNDNA